MDLISCKYDIGTADVILVAVGIYLRGLTLTLTIRPPLSLKPTPHDSSSPLWYVMVISTWLKI